MASLTEWMTGTFSGEDISYFWGIGPHWGFAVTLMLDQRSEAAKMTRPSKKIAVIVSHSALWSEQYVIDLRPR
jgi:hypothetical protein